MTRSMLYLHVCLRRAVIPEDDGARFHAGYVDEVERENCFDSIEGGALLLAFTGMLNTQRTGLRSDIDGASASARLKDGVLYKAEAIAEKNGAWYLRALGFSLEVSSSEAETDASFFCFTEYATLREEMDSNTRSSRSSPGHRPDAVSSSSAGVLKYTEC